MFTMIDGIVIRCHEHHRRTIPKVKKKIIKNNSLMAFVTIDDLYGSFEVIVFESIFNKCASYIEEEKIVLIER